MRTLLLLLLLFFFFLTLKACIFLQHLSLHGNPSLLLTESFSRLESPTPSTTSISEEGLQTLLPIGARMSLFQSYLFSICLLSCCVGPLHSMRALCLPGFQIILFPRSSYLWSGAVTQIRSPITPLSSSSLEEPMLDRFTKSSKETRRLRRVLPKEALSDPQEHVESWVRKERLLWDSAHSLYLSHSSKALNANFSPAIFLPLIF